MNSHKQLLLLLILLNIGFFASLAYAQNINLSSINLKNQPQYAYVNTFVFSPKTLKWYAYGHNGQIINSGKASGGSSYCKDIKRSCRTITGKFHVISKGGAGCKSSIYPVGKGGAPMPYCAFFTSKYAVHGSYEIPHYNASHGCIRITPAAAQWLHYNFFKIGTPIIVLPY